MRLQRSPLCLIAWEKRVDPQGARVSIDAIATNPAIAQKILDQGADYLLAVKANQPTLRAEMEAYFADAPEEVVETFIDIDKGHGRIEERALICRCRRQLASGRSPVSG